MVLRWSVCLLFLSLPASSARDASLPLGTPQDGSVNQDSSDVLDLTVPVTDMDQLPVGSSHICRGPGSNCCTHVHVGTNTCSSSLYTCMLCVLSAIYTFYVYDSVYGILYIYCILVFLLLKHVGTNTCS